MTNLSLQTQDTLSFLVSIKDKVSESGDSANDNFVKVPISIIILDENDNPPEFQNVSRHDESVVLILRRLPFIGVIEMSYLCALGIKSSELNSKKV